MKDKINKFVGQNLGNHSDGNGSSSTKRLKFISFSINNRSSHFEQFIIKIEMIHVSVKNIKANNTMSISFV